MGLVTRYGRDSLLGRVTLEPQVFQEPPRGLAETNLHFYTCCKVELHQGIDCFLSRLNDIEQSLVGADFVLVARVFVDVRRDQDGKLFLFSRERDRTLNLGTGALCSLDDFLRRQVNQPVVESLKTYTNPLILHLRNTPNNNRLTGETLVPRKKEAAF